MNSVKAHNDTKHHMKVNHFNLLEIVLAMAIIAVGVISIMGLFPIGLDANRQSRDNVYATLAANMVADHLATEFKQIELETLHEQYSDTFNSKRLHIKSFRRALAGTFYMMDTNEKDTEGEPDQSYLPDAPAVKKDSDWELMTDISHGAEIYRLKLQYEFENGSTTPTRLETDNHMAAYRVVFKTQTGTGSDDYTIDFDCIVMCGLGEYESRIYYDDSDKTKDWRFPGPRLATVVQWPANKAPIKRESATFTRRLKTINLINYRRRKSKGVNVI